MRNVKRSYWAYCWSGFPLGIVYLVFIFLILLSCLDGSDGSQYAIEFFSFCLVVVIGFSVGDYIKNG